MPSLHLSTTTQGLWSINFVDPCVLKSNFYVEISHSKNKYTSEEVEKKRMKQEQGRMKEQKMKEEWEYQVQECRELRLESQEREHEKQERKEQKHQEMRQECQEQEREEQECEEKKHQEQELRQECQEQKIKEEQKPKQGSWEVTHQGWELGPLPTPRETGSIFRGDRGRSGQDCTIM